MYAIIETGGKQYRLTPGDILSVESLEGTVGQKLTLDKVLLVGGKDNQVLVGTPYVASATTEVEIVDHAKGDKILTIKYRRRKGYRRTIGHRQHLTRLLVTKISDGRGGSIEFDSSKRLEALRKASIRTSEAKERPAKKAAATAEAAPAKRSTATKSAAPKAKTAKTKKA